MRVPAAKQGTVVGLIATFVSEGMKLALANVTAPSPGRVMTVSPSPSMVVAAVTSLAEPSAPP